ncbi:MAG: MFS transporter [Acidobacteria bacterium]|nr:MFS transporter [Acidobacteriota bacterium]
MKRFSLWIPSLTMLLVSLISYIDRNTLALLAPTILAETGLSAEQYGFVISAFSIAYMAGNPLWGRALDRFGLRPGMLAAVSFWSLASAAHALAGGFLSFGAARTALGFGEGATFPGGLRTVVQTLPPSRRARGIAVAYSGGSLGAIVTPLIVTPIAMWWGWRAAFLFTGMVGVAWLGVWLVVSRRPEIRVARRDPGVGDTQARIGVLDRKLWAFMLAYAFGAIPLAFVIYGAPIYLSRALGKSQAAIGAVLWLPPLGWEIGYFVWGWLADRARGNGGLARLMLTAAVLSLPLALAARIGSFPLAMAELFFSMFVAAGFIILAMSYATRVFSSSHAGLVAGFGAGAWSALVALVMPVFGRLLDLRAWDAAFSLAALLPLAGFAAWRLLATGAGTTSGATSPAPAGTEAGRS